MNTVTDQLLNRGADMRRQDDDKIPETTEMTKRWPNADQTLTNSAVTSSELWQAQNCDTISLFDNLF